VWLIVANTAAMLVGVRFYVDTMGGVSTFLWPLYADSPMAVFLMALSLMSLVPFLGDSLGEIQTNRVLAYLHTLTFVWLVKMGLWTAAALNLGFTAYFPEPWAYFGIILTHMGFIAEALLIPHYGATTRGALGVALVITLANDLLDYGFGYHPPLRYDPGIGLLAATVAISLITVYMASVIFPRLPENPR
jgi:uncharacterized membrane protein YpjA